MVVPIKFPNTTFLSPVSSSISLTAHGREIEKATHWYSMKAGGNQQLVPQTEEDISELKWVAKGELGEYLENSYNNIVEIVERYLADLNITK